MEGNHLDHWIWRVAARSFFAVRRSSRWATGKLSEGLVSQSESVVFSLASPKNRTFSPKNSNHFSLLSNLIHSCSISSPGFNDHLHLLWSVVNGSMPIGFGNEILILNHPYLLRFLPKSCDLWMENDPHNLYSMNMLLHEFNDVWIRFHRWNRKLTFLKLERDLKAWEAWWKWMILHWFFFTTPYSTNLDENIESFWEILMIWRIQVLREMRGFKSFVTKWFFNPLHGSEGLNI